MKLILSSCDFRNEKSKQVILENLGKPIEKCKVLFIPNEKANIRRIKNKKYLPRLLEAGFSEENIAVFNYYDSEKFFGLSFDVVYVSGGNTFGTFERLKECNFTEEIMKLVKNGAVYIGGSAGAHIACPDFSHVSKYDENNTALTDFKGLGLFDGYLICHFTEDRRQDFENLQKQYKKVYALTDEDALVYEDNE